MIKIPRIPRDVLEQYYNENKSPTVSDADFVTMLLSGLAEDIAAKFKSYRSFGIMWWPLKRMMIEHDITKFGDEYDVEVDAMLRQDTDLLTLVAVIIHRDKNIDTGLIYSVSDYLTTDSGDSITVAVEDSQLERVITYSA